MPAKHTDQSPEAETRNAVPTNSAKRLVEVLETVRQNDGVWKEQTTQTHLSGWSVLATAFGLIEPGPIAAGPRACYKTAGLFIAMVESVEGDIGRLKLDEDDKAFYREALPSIVKAMHPRKLSANWSDLRKELSPVDLNNLKHVDRVVRRENPERMLMESDLAQLLGEVEESIGRLNAAELDAELKDFILQQLLRIKTAVDQYRFRGAAGLQQALASYAGSLAMAKDELSAVSHAATEVSLTDKLLKVVKVGKLALSVAQSAKWIWPHLVDGADLIGRFSP